MSIAGAELEEGAFEFATKEMEDQSGVLADETMHRSTHSTAIPPPSPLLHLSTCSYLLQFFLFVSPFSFDGFPTTKIPLLKVFLFVFSQGL
jgi:hypothetical protein